jgi:hypothetical protein
MALPLSAIQAVPGIATDPPTPLYLPLVHAPQDETPAVPGQFVVLWKPGAAPGDLVAPGGAQVVQTIEPLNLEVIDVSSIQLADSGAARTIIDGYRTNPGVAAVEPNYLYRTMDTPNDPDTGRQWAWGAIGAFTAWDVTRGSPDVVIAVVDTGIQRSHPDLDAKIVPGYDFVDSDSAPDDGNGHGTHVAGTAAAETNNATLGAGLCPACRLMPLRALGNGGSGSLADVARAISYAADNGARVINLSLGGPGSATLQRAVEYAWSKGTFLACAAGNSNTSRPSYPAGYDSCFAVASTTSSDARSSFSNFGSWVEAAAPGSAIYSTWLNGRSSTLSGTSMATPHVAGLAGLLASQGLTNAQIRDRLCSTADRISGTGTAWTCGRINADRAVRGLGGPPPSPIPSPTLNPTPVPSPGPSPTPRPSPDPTPVPGGREAIVNGGFEQGASGWTFSAGDILSTGRAATGQYSARLGGENDSTDLVDQTVTVPSNGVLTYTWFPEGSNDMADMLRLEVTTLSGSTMRLWVGLNATNGRWYQRTVNLAGFGGRMVRIRFSAVTNGSSPTAFYVDNVSLR